MKWIEAKPVESKSCGTCALCCKVFDVDWLDRPKPAGRWCHHCKPGVGCSIWQTLPAGCANYFCIWRLDPALGPEWRPDVARFLLTHAHQDAPLALLVDSGAPDAHRREPYRTKLAKTARDILEARGSTIVVFNGRHRSLLFPDCEIAVPDGVELHEIRIVASEGMNGRQWRPVFPNH